MRDGRFGDLQLGGFNGRGGQCRRIRLLLVVVVVAAAVAFAHDGANTCSCCKGNAKQEGRQHRAQSTEHRAIEGWLESFLNERKQSEKQPASVGAARKPPEKLPKTKK